MTDRAGDGVYRLINTVQEYSWGSRSAIPELLGLPSPADAPQAELWMGAHPKSPSWVQLDDENRISLADMIARDPVGVLGGAVAEKFSGRLPFLFKVLAAARPLSIQAHPNRQQAREGFSRENRRGIALDAFDRNYRDDNHKPEIVSALTPFWAMNGFRPPAEIAGLFGSVGFSSLGEPLRSFRSEPSPAGLKSLFAALMRLKPGQREHAVAEAVRWAREGARRGADAAADGTEAAFSRASGTDTAIPGWILHLAEQYPDDIGVLSPLLLNLVLLQPGDTMFLQAGVLHAYLQGTAIELMANSDNVIRGGLTPKHVDVEELLTILRFEGGGIRLSEAVETAPGVRVFPTAAEEFSLAEVRVEAKNPYRSPSSGRIELMIAVEGEGRLEAASMHMTIRRGDSLLVTAATGAYSIRGSLDLYKAFVPS